MILGSLFQNGAVFQREKNIPVWGRTAPRCVVYAEFDGAVAKTRSSGDGDFMLFLPAHAAGGPFELIVSAPEAEESITLSDILVGEVFLASGQSNMEYQLGTDWRIEKPENAPEPLSRKQERQFKEMLLDSDKFRFFTVEQNVSGAAEKFCGGSWMNMNAENCSKASAVAAWCMLGIQYQLENIPVGVIISAVGATGAVAWMSKEALAAEPETFADYRKICECSWNGSFWEKNTVWKYEDGYDKLGPGNYKTPSILFDAMIRPLIPYAVRGVLWYQGEGNTLFGLAGAKAYRDIMQALIDDWRRCWQDPDMPFFMVQLAGYSKKEAFNKESLWAELRESQRLIARDDPYTYTVCAVDAGDEGDMHPQNKFDVGKRLSMSVLYHVYGCENAVPSGPEVVRAERFTNIVRVFFKYADGLKLVSDEPAFFLAGKDGEFHAADKVEVDDNTLIISSEKVREPVELRYAWADFPSMVLYNGAGVPASSFSLEIV